MNKLPIKQYKLLISKAIELKEKIKTNKLEMSDINEFINSFLETVPKDFNPKIIEPEIAEDMFKEYLLTKEFPDPNNRVYTHYWGYNDTLSSEELEKIMKIAIDEDCESFADAANYNALSDYDTYDDIIHNDISEIINNFYNQTEFAEEIIEMENNFDVDLFNIFYKEIEYNLNLHDLLKRSRFEDLTIYFEEDKKNYNSSITNDFINIFEKPEFLIMPRRTTIDWLLMTQGYSRNDVINKDKRNESIFLTTLYEELFEYNSYNFDNCNLIALPESDNFEVIFALAKKEPIIIKNNTLFGLFDRLNGDGSGLNITLEKDILINSNTPKYYLTYNKGQKRGNYSPTYVFGNEIRGKRNTNKLSLPKKEIQ